MEPGQETRRRRMSGPARRRQLIDVARSTFAERSFEGTAMEEIAARAGVSKPVVYEHFGTKEALYRVVVEEETQRLERIIGESMERARSRLRIEKAVLALLGYVENHADGFTILARDPATAEGYATLLGLATGRVSHILGAAFERAGLEPRNAILYSQALVGMIAQTAQWWMDERGAGAGEWDREAVAAHIVNLCWNGLANMEAEPRLRRAAPGELPDEGVRLGAGPDADPADDDRG
ncbi:TetR/AcrR family transcriptional regulator [Corynebacterium sp.]|uniref:TetR/AcrR family transcriptional regulator n=1 Tax=Corynebacterium sp. TaxID=1720 RepID=UPI0026DC549F|nr:TetR/AcrR family transcriptional regulator [Corynebacterium sp.]MDO4610665.1 TetR/AcrR family transcriptional regulator [Corynebacterium sp.]